MGIITLRYILSLCCNIITTIGQADYLFIVLCFVGLHLNLVNFMGPPRAVGLQQPTQHRTTVWQSGALQNFVYPE